VFDIGLQEMLVIGVLALLVFGPSKLPELGRLIGRAMRELRRASDEFRTTVETNLHINDLDPVPTIATAPPASTADASLAVPASSSSPSEAENAGVVEGATPSAPDEAGEPFCAQRGSRLFHRRECAWVGRIPELERVYLKTVAEARDKGFVTCPVCEPWEPS
jgi:sec-independent protein translocase protein TatB